MVETIAERKTAALARLSELVAECSEPGWDGEDAAPVDLTAAQWAERFVCALPEGFPLPELGVDPDGSIALDWIPSRHRLWSVSIGPSGRLAYAYLDGPDKGHGVADFDGQSVPSRILQGVEIVVRGECGSAGR